MTSASAPSATSGGSPTSATATARRDARGRFTGRRFVLQHYETTMIGSGYGAHAGRSRLVPYKTEPVEVLAFHEAGATVIRANGRVGYVAYLSIEYELAVEP